MAALPRGSSIGDESHARLLRRVLHPLRVLDAPAARAMRRLECDATLPIPSTTRTLAAEMDARLHPACTGSVHVQHLGSPQRPVVRGTMWTWDVLGHEDEAEWPAEGHYMLCISYCSGTFTLARGNELLVHDGCYARSWRNARRFLPPFIPHAVRLRAGHSR